MKLLKENYRQLLTIIIMNVFLVLIVELFWRKLSVGSWMISDFYSVFANAGIIILATSMITLLTRRYSVSYIIVASLIVVLGLINAKKIALRNVPLLIDDVSLINEVLELIPKFATFTNIVLLTGLLGLITTGAYFLIKYEKKWLGIKLNHLVIASLISLGLVIPWQVTYGNQTDISSTGLLMSLINDYNKEEITYDFETYELEVKEVVITEDKRFQSDIKPNVIVIQSEAFWDVTKLDLNFNRDPIPNFHALREESMTGYMYVPVIGGGTVNTEFEILTGMTLKNYDFDSYMVYPNEIHQPTVSMASILRKQGYYALATHPFNAWYYNRTEVFNHMGFNEFKSIEFMDEPEKLGSYVTDRYITDEIIKNIEETDEPLFNTVLTMQNHAPFNDWRFKRDDLVVTFTDSVTEEALDTINNYSNSLYLSDLELNRLIEYLRGSEEATIVLFYGDHLPYMGDDYKVFREVGYIGDEIFVNENLEMMSTPFIIWSNMTTEKKDLGLLNASYLPALILNEMAIEVPTYINELVNMYQEIPVFTRKTGYLSSGDTITSDDPVYQAFMKKYYFLSENKDLDDDWLFLDNSTFNQDYDMDLIKQGN